MPLRSFDESLRARGDTEFPARIVEVKLDGALAQTENRSDFLECLAACGPGERLDFTLAQTDECGPDRAAGDACEPRGNQRGKHIIVHGLDEVIVGAEPPPLELTVMITQRRERHQRACSPKRGSWT